VCVCVCVSLGDFLQPIYMWSITKNISALGIEIHCIHFSSFLIVF